MAKHTTRSSTSGSSKIRFIMLEAELNDGNLTQITQAISNALNKGSGLPQRFIASPPVGPNGGTTETDDAQPADDLVSADVDQAEVKPDRPKRARKLTAPKVLPDVDLNSGGMPFGKFAEEKSPSSDLSRHLLSAYWFKAYRNLDAITDDHAYTCYKKVGWGTDIKDFAQPFRDLARQGRGDVKDGKFAINHIGDDVIEKMGRK